jgi:hypothetical protein
MRRDVDEILKGVRIRAPRKRTAAEYKALAGEPDDGGLESVPVKGPSAAPLDGFVFLVGNASLGIPPYLSLRHPSCVVRDGVPQVRVSKGTHAAHVRDRYRRSYVIVQPDWRNGLWKPTAFEPFLRSVPRRAFFQQDCLGELSPEDLMRLREAVDRHDSRK